MKDKIKECIMLFLLIQILIKFLLSVVQPTVATIYSLSFWLTFVSIVVLTWLLDLKQLWPRLLPFTLSLLSL